MKVLKIFAKECSNYELGLVFTFLWQGQVCLRSFIWENVIEVVEDVVAKVINTVKLMCTWNIFCDRGQDHVLTRLTIVSNILTVSNYQVCSNDEFEIF